MAVVVRGAVVVALGIAVLSTGPVHAQGESARPLAEVLASGYDASALAGRNGVSEEELRAMALGGHFEVDAADGIRSVEPVVPAGARSEVTAPAGVDVFALHSRPGAARTLFLDFDGHSVRDTRWRGGERIVAPPYDADGDPAVFGAAERDTVYAAFLATAENFRPFGVDVTTQEPPADRIERTGAEDLEFGSRVVVTPVDVTGCGCGGQSYIGVFDRYVDHDAFQPSWAYTGAGSSDGKLIAEVASHEAGHTLGLLHDGQGGGSEYYSGHQGWASIMGAAHEQPVTQWSKGEYRNPTNRQDDIKVMAGKGIPLAADDVVGAVPVGGTVSGVIGSDADSDDFLVRHGGGVLAVSALPARFSPNLDIRMTVLGASGVVVLSLCV